MVNYFREIHGRLHCINDYEYYQKKEDLQVAVDLMEKYIEESKENDAPEEGIEDLKTLLSVLRDVANGDRPLSDGQKVAEFLESGLSWYISEPEDCPGYSPEMKSDVDNFNLEVPVAEL